MVITRATIVIVMDAGWVHNQVQRSDTQGLTIRMLCQAVVPQPDHSLAWLISQSQSGGRRCTGESGKVRMSGSFCFREYVLELSNILYLRRVQRHRKVVRALCISVWWWDAGTSINQNHSLTFEFWHQLLLGMLRLWELGGTWRTIQQSLTWMKSGDVECGKHIL